MNIRNQKGKNRKFPIFLKNKLLSIYDFIVLFEVNNLHSEIKRFEGKIIFYYYGICFEIALLLD